MFLQVDLARRRPSMLEAPSNMIQLVSSERRPVTSELILPDTRVDTKCSHSNILLALCPCLRT